MNGDNECVFSVIFGCEKENLVFLHTIQKKNLFENLLISHKV